ncbi:insulinase family protein [Paracoccus sp. Z118]|uniref:M16 family metallopeptidase n=1 Tax=Paracoccus sp. Z118 TaxID=2851017 RepID=UPI001C2BC223|nr:pitrilysin family protein [Paracoccus sp. Z118]MBV0891194.1 insulinase family protein [Paracoccus sp. Z118]
MRRAGPARRFPLSAALIALAPAAALAEMPPGVTHFTLQNGMEAVVIEDHRAPVVVQMVWYRIGSADEEPGKTGLAHYLEHLMFKGTDTMAPGELSRTVTANGGMDNAFTSYDFTAYFQRIAADRLPLVMRMEADRMANLQIGEDDWQAERQVVLEERAQRTDSDPAALFGEEVSAVQFYNHPYGNPVIGWRHEMMGLTREDALAWYDEHYAPNAAVLVVAGDVTPEQVRALAQEHYGAIPAKPSADRDARPQEPVQRTERRVQMTDPRVPQPVLSRGVIAPERNPGDQKTAAALAVLADLLGGPSQTSVLGKSLMLTGKAVYAGARYNGLSVDPTTFSLTVVPAPGVSQEETEAMLAETVAQFLADGPDPDALERVRTRLRADRIYERDSAHGRAYDYGQGLSIGLTVEDVNDWPEILAAVTAEDVMNAARLVLDGQPGVTSWLLPEPGAAVAQAGDAPVQIPAGQIATADDGGAAPVAADAAAMPDAAEAASESSSEAAAASDSPAAGEADLLQPLSETREAPPAAAATDSSGAAAAPRPTPIGSERPRQRSGQPSDPTAASLTDTPTPDNPAPPDPVVTPEDSSATIQPEPQP